MPFHPQPELPLVVVDLHFDPPRAGVPERIAQRLGGDPVDFVPQDRSQIPRRAFHIHAKLGAIPALLIRGQLLSQRGGRAHQVVVTTVEERSPCTASRPSIIAARACNMFRCRAEAGSTIQENARDAFTSR